MKKVIYGCACCLFAASVQAAVVCEYDASTSGGALPTGVIPAWTVATNGGTFTHEGSYILQSTTKDNYYDFTSPAMPAGTIDSTKDYGLEVKVKPLTDMNLGTTSQWAQHVRNMAIVWGDGVNAYAVGFDLYTNNTSGTGGVVASPFNAPGFSIFTGIDWSTAHTVFVGYHSEDQTFKYYLDGVYKATMAIADVRYNNTATTEGKNQLVFGDAYLDPLLPGDQQAEWYFVNVQDTNIVPEPASLTLIGLGSLLGLIRTRRHK